MIISVIIVNYKSTNLINDIEKIVSNISCLEIIVVDNSGDFISHSNNTKVITNKNNVGFGSACNIGAKYSDGKFLLFLNPDIKLSHGVIYSIIENCISHEKSIVGISVVDGGRASTTLIPYGRFGITYKRDFLKSPYIDNPIFISGACMAMSKLVFESLNGFDENIFLYAEDLDLCVRARARGISLFRDEKIEVYHIGGGTQKAKNKFNVLAKIRRLYFSFCGHYVFFRKNNGYFSSVLNAIYLSSGFIIKLP